MATLMHGAGAASGPVTPAQCDEALDALAGAEGFGKQTTGDERDCADTGQPPQPSDDAASAKRAATLGALLAMEGWELRALPSGAYTVSRWGHARHCTSLDAVAAFAKLVGVRV